MSRQRNTRRKRKGAADNEITFKRTNKMNITTTPTQKKPDMKTILKMVGEKKEWLRHSDREALADRYHLTLTSVARHLSGKVKKINASLVADALDMANKYE